MIQSERYRRLKFNCNNQLGVRWIREFCKLSQEGNAFLGGLIEKMNLSARAYDRILKVGRTIADLEGSQDINMPHLLEAAQYRGLDREIW